MHNSLPILAATFACVVCAPNAMADSPWSLSTTVGGNFQLDSDIKGSGVNTEVEFDTALTLNGTVGYEFADYGPGAFRGEAEVFYRGADVDEFQNGGGTGDYDSYGLMANIVYEFSDNDWPVKPYVGAGIGIANVDADVNGPDIRIDDDDTVFAYQVIGGAAWEFAPQWDLIGDVRYLSAEEPEYRSRTSAPVEMEFDSFSVSVGVRYRFS